MNSPLETTENAKMRREGENLCVALRSLWFQIKRELNCQD